MEFTVQFQNAGDMKMKEYIPALIPSLTLASINLVLCLLFAAGAAGAIGITYLLHDVWNLAAPLLPVVILFGIPISVIAWTLFSLRIHQPRPIRWVITILGTTPLTATVTLAGAGAIWLVTLPGTTQSPTLFSIIVCLLAAAATGVCALCVMATPHTRDEPTE